MRQFAAILKDSFREAVDGFVIYLMLGLAFLLMLLVASVGYIPQASEDALPDLLRQFNVIFPDRGASKSPTGVPGVLEYKPRDIQQAGDGSVLFTLDINAPGDGPKGEVRPKLTGHDLFRYAVVAWKSPPGEKVFDPRVRNRNRNKNTRGDDEPEVVMPPNATPDDLNRVTDDEMVAFLKNQFALFVGVRDSDVTVSRVAGVAEPEYRFDVALRNATGARGWPHSITILFGAFGPYKVGPLGAILYGIQDHLVNGIGAGVTLIIGVIITAFFIPNLLRKGSVDLLVSKPISRSALLVYKYIGGLTFIFLLSSFTIGGVWLVMAARSGHWNPSFLFVIPALTFTFAILYAVSTLVAVFTRSAIASILVTIGFMFVMWGLGKFLKGLFDRNKVTQDFDIPEWAYTLVNTLNNILPRYSDLDRLTTKVIADGNLPVGLSRLIGVFVDYPSWAGAIGVSTGFIALMLAISCWWFGRRDY